MPKPKHKERAPKATAAQACMRVREVQDMILLGFTSTDILQKTAKWNLSDRQVRDYVKKAKDIIHEHNQAGFEENVALVISNLWDNFRECKKFNDRKGAREALAQIAKIRGLENATINHVVSARELQSLSNEELDELIEG